MTRTEDLASSRSRKQDATRSRTGLRRAWQTLAVVPVVLLLGALLMPASALAAESTSGYSQTAPTPQTSTTPAPTPTSGTSPSTTPAPTPTSGTSPSKEAKTTPEATAPAKETAPTTSTSPSKAATLPFTGLDLGWIVAIGVLLVALGCSILAVQRRQHGRSG